RPWGRPTRLLTPRSPGQRGQLRGRTARKALLRMGSEMKTPTELDPDVDDVAPTGDQITSYDEQHFVTYLRLLDAKAEDADWKEVAQIVLHRDPVAEELRTYRCWQSHLERAQWLSREGYKRILEQAAANKA